jgi:hypothetical protein
VTAATQAIVNLDIPGPVISRHIYGHFAEHLGHCVYGGFYVGENIEMAHDGGIRLYADLARQTAPSAATTRTTTSTGSRAARTSTTTPGPRL